MSEPREDLERMIDASFRDKAENRAQVIQAALRELMEEHTKMWSTDKGSVFRRLEDDNWGSVAGFLRTILAITELELKGEDHEE